MVAQVRGLPSPVIDRSVIEQIFQVQRRQAHKILAEFGAHQLGSGRGRTLVLTRDELAARLEGLVHTERLQAVFDLLEKNVAQPIEVQDAARACAMSSSHFMKFFKMTVGQTFCTYLTSFRIARAQHMLLNNEVPIAEISQLVGFCSQSYFGEVFRSIVGMTPRAYR